MLLTSHGTVVLGRRIYQLLDQKRRQDAEMGIEGVQDVAEAKTGIRLQSSPTHRGSMCFSNLEVVCAHLPVRRMGSLVEIS